MTTEEKTKIEERIVDVEEIKEISAKMVEESVRPIARKNIKEC